MGETFADIVTSGPLVLGVAVALLAGLVSFFSPCVLPLVPGYLAYVTGLSGADLDAARTGGASRAGAGRATAGTGEADGAGDRGAPATGGPAVVVAPRPRRGVTGRVLAGSLLFTAGFAAVFVTVGVLAAAAGRALRDHERVLEVAGGLLMVLFALALLGLVPWLQREVRIQRLPAAGLLGAPVFGAVFALSWIPCVGPTIGAVLTLGTLGGQTTRAAVLAVAYTLGLGLPLLAFGLGFRTLAGVLPAVRRHSRWVTRVGAVLLLLIGLALLSGFWGDAVLWLRSQIGVGEVAV